MSKRPNPPLQSQASPPLHAQKQATLRGGPRNGLAFTDDPHAQLLRVPAYPGSPAWQAVSAVYRRRSNGDWWFIRLENQ